MIIFWAVVLVVAILLEAATFALISVWFAVGSIAGLIAASLGAPVWLQFVLFIALSAVLLIFTRPLIKKLFPNRFIPTNTELSIGKSAVVIEEINSLQGKGRARLNGVDWMAVSENDEVIPEGTTVTVTKVNGAKIFVETIK